MDLQGVAVQREIDERAVRRQAERALERQIDVLHRISRIAFESLELGGKLVRIIQQIADALVHQRQLVTKEGELLKVREIMHDLAERSDDLREAQIFEIEQATHVGVGRYSQRAWMGDVAPGDVNFRLGRLRIADDVRCHLDRQRKIGGSGDRRSRDDGIDVAR